MFTLRCTDKLLRRGLPLPDSKPAQPTTLLGDWYANVLYSRPQQLILCLSERTLLPVIVPAKGIKSLPTQVRQVVRTVLAALDIDPKAVQAEDEQMMGARVGRTANRSVVGSLNDFVFQLEHGLHDWPERSLLEHALWLAQTPCKPIEYASPDRATVALFESSLIVDAARAKSQRSRE